MHGGKILDRLTMGLRHRNGRDEIIVRADIFDNRLSHKWLDALVHVITGNYHLEKNYCWVGWPNSERDGGSILESLNQSIDAINRAHIGYEINDRFTMANCMTDEPRQGRCVGRNIIHERLNQLHRYFEDLQGTSGHMPVYWQRADSATRWHIRQLNLLCHEFECWALSYRKEIEAPEWIRPSTLMCWLNAPRFRLDENDYDLFGIESLNRDTGGIYVGVNKAVGKHHWEVFNDEGSHSRLSELTTTGLRSQTEAAGDFDIEWGRSTREFAWQQQRLQEFRTWLVQNGFCPDDPALTIGHPKVAQVDLQRSFQTDNYIDIWQQLGNHLDVAWIEVAGCRACYAYHWSDPDYAQQQINIMEETRNV